MTKQIYARYRYDAQSYDEAVLQVTSVIRNLQREMRESNRQPLWDTLQINVDQKMIENISLTGAGETYTYSFLEASILTTKDGT